MGRQNFDLNRHLLLGLVVASTATIPRAATGAPPATTIQGTWAQRLVTTSVAKLPIVGKSESVSQFYAVTSIKQSGSSIEMSVKPCWVDIDSSMKRVRTVIPPAMTRVMGPTKRSGEVVGRRVHIEGAYDVLGARLANEATDPLPTDASDATVLDEDGDGKPGVTVKIFGPIDGELYLAQRSWNEFTGRVGEDGDSITGRVRWSTQQSILGATSIFLKVNPRASAHPDASRHHFEMRRVPDTTTCAALRSQRAKLFDEK